MSVFQRKDENTFDNLSNIFQILTKLLKSKEKKENLAQLISEYASYRSKILSNV